MTATSRAWEPLDLIGIGIGPFNLSLAALLEPVPAVRACFLERQPGFDWHPGLLLEDATIQVPFLADLVTLVDPTSRHSFLAYLREHDRLYRFYFRERFHLLRREYNHYCQWVAANLASCRFSSNVTGLRWRPGEHCFEVDVTAVPNRRQERLRAANVVLGIGTAPRVPAPFAGLLGKDVFHSSQFLAHRERLRTARHVTVIGSGQSGAEVFEALLRDQDVTGYRLSWLTRSPGFLPMEYSKLGLEHFSPEYVRYFHALPAAERDRLLPTQNQLYKAIDADTIAGIYDLLYERTVGGREPAVQLLANTEVRALSRDGDELRLEGHHRQQRRGVALRTDAVVLATGYEASLPPWFDELRPLVDADAHGRLRVDLDYRVTLDASVDGALFVQNAELHTHGIGTPDLGLGAHRGATIVNAVTGRTVYPLPERTVFTQFGVA
ncbi:MAG: SidA/IucD/PvdA family monooxygenase [Nitriliruptorales bacterium]|nr:SidA/IucD/PvdA family monooxygenase [Nitriliruptorales bacterium]